MIKTDNLDDFKKQAKTTLDYIEQINTCLFIMFVLYSENKIKIKL